MNITKKSFGSACAAITLGLGIAIAGAGAANADNTGMSDRGQCEAIAAQKNQQAAESRGSDSTHSTFLTYECQPDYVDVYGNQLWKVTGRYSDI
ncbi:hypothetical protein ACFWPX_36400 [Nocardia sp. NPDC058518]|uniref:hypothetical protein n=1 Tax=Nocardia sp. NPDC058518 TaxID=3346534 RepID=UPI00364C5435